VKIVLTSGHPHSGYRLAHETLVAVGLVPAQPSRREAKSAAELHQHIFHAHDLDPTGLSGEAQLSPGKVWQEMAVDLFMGNLAHKNWGWADARTVWLLDFWKAFDPQIRFVLVYSAPEFALGQMLCEQGSTPERIELAVSSWMACNTEILRFYHRNPECCLLVNASAIQHLPTSFINKAVDTFSLTLDVPIVDHQVDHTGISLVASSLAKGLIEDRDDAISLYLELESTADVNTLDGLVLDSEKRQAWQEYTDLLARMSEAADEAQAQRESAGQLRQDYEMAMQALSETKSQLAEQAAKIIEAKTSASHRTAISQLQTKADELSQENELLLLQLHQVQEELEHYFLQYQELAGKGPQKVDQIFECRTLKQNTQATEIIFDLRHEIAGENWYEAESDGRWAGPDDVSFIQIPSQGSGEYELQLDVVDAMEPEILYELEVSLNGTHLPISKDWGAYPAIVLAQFSTESIAQRQQWEFQLKFPKLVSPSQHGLDDLRNLAIRLRTLKLRKL
jgi:hypothetical protein